MQACSKSNLQLNLGLIFLELSGILFFECFLSIVGWIHGCKTYGYRQLTELRCLPRWLNGKESACQYRSQKRREFSPWVWKVSWRRKWKPNPVFVPGKSHWQRSQVDYSPQDLKEQARLSTHTHTHTHTHTTELNILNICLHFLPLYLCLNVPFFFQYKIFLVLWIFKILVFCSF